MVRLKEKIRPLSHEKKIIKNLRWALTYSIKTVGPAHKIIKKKKLMATPKKRLKTSHQHKRLSFFFLETFSTGRLLSFILGTAVGFKELL